VETGHRCLAETNTKPIKSGSAHVPASSHAHQGQALCVGPRALTRMRSSQLSGTEPEVKVIVTMKEKETAQRRIRNVHPANDIHSAVSRLPPCFSPGLIARPRHYRSQRSLRKGGPAKPAIEVRAWLLRRGVLFQTRNSNSTDVRRFGRYLS
jgi:hypothetical protein